MLRYCSSAYRLNPYAIHELRGRWLCRLVLLAGLLGLTGCDRTDTEDAVKEPSRKEHIVQKGAFVHFTLSGTDFKIPKVYAAGGAKQYGHLTDAKLHALLPEFVGYEPDKNGETFRYEFSKQLGWGRKLYVQLTERGHNAAYPFAWVTGQNESVYSPIYGRDGVYDEIRYGLEYYRNTRQSHDSRNEYFLYRHNGIPIVSITCRPYNPSPGCELKWVYNQFLNGEMDFGMQHLPKWHEIWSKANSLFENGTTAGFDEAAWQARVTKTFAKDYYQWTATLPDFQPCHPEGCSDRFKVRGEQPGYDHRLYVRVSPRSQNAKPLPELWRDSYENRTGYFISVGEQYDEMRYGLEFHRGKMMRSSEAFHNDIYVRLSGGTPEVVFSCYAEANRHTENPILIHDGCVGQWALPSNDIVYAAFSREYLPIWEEIMVWASSQGMRAEQNTSNQRQGE